MYLEISPRQSGKTARLIETVLRCTASGRKAIIVSPRKAMSNVIQKQLLQHRSPSYWEGKVILATSYELEEINKPDNTIYYFDEFDFMENVPIDENAYYVTTPSKLRSYEALFEYSVDPLITLLKSNGYQYHHFPSTSQLSMSLSSLDRKAYLTEVMGMFLEVRV